MNLFDLVARLTLDSSEYDRALMTAKGTADSAGGDMVASIGRTKKAIGVAALGMGAAIGAFGVSSVKTGMEFDSAMSQVAATMGKTMADMEDEVGSVDLAWGSFSGNLREYAQEMGAHTKFSATEAAEALNYMALAGYDTQKSMEMLPSVLSLAAAGNMELATASDMVTDASSALGLSQEETVAMVDQMAAASSKSNTSVEQLGQAMLTVGGTAKVLKGGTTELSTALGILADNGTKGAEGGTALRNILTAIQGGKFEKTFGALGVEAYDAQGNLRSLEDVFLDMQTAMEGMTDEEKTDIINKTFNARDLKNVNALLGTSKDRWDELSASIVDSEGAAQQMADTQLDNLEGDITLLKSAFEGLQISVADKLEPAFRTLVQGLTWAIDHADTLGPIILGLATAFGVFAVAINIGSIIQSVTGAFAAFNAILAANPIGIIVALIAGLVVAIVALWKNNEDFRNKVIEIWNGITAGIGGAIDSVKGFFTGLKDKAGEIKDGIAEKFEGIKTAISEKIEGAKEKVSGAVEAIKGFFSFSGAAAKVSGVFGTIRSAIQSKIDAARSRVSTAVSGIKGFLSFSGAAGKAKAAFESIKQGISDKIQAAKDKVRGVIDTIKGYFPFSIGKVMSNLKLPHFTKTGSFSLNPPSVPSFSVSWYKKAEDMPYLFSNATLFGAGERNDEILYGRNSLMRDIKEATSGSGGDMIFNLNYDASDDANDILRDVARGAQRLKMAGVI